MAAPGNSRGVKIAVAIFAPLTLALLATSCLSYAAYASAVAAELSAKSDRIAAVTEYREVVANYEELRRRIGIARASTPKSSMRSTRVSKRSTKSSP